VTLMLLAGSLTLAASNGDGRYEIRMDYGKSMTGMGETRAGEQSYFMWRFGDGRKSVAFLGSDPKIDPTTFWPTTGDGTDEEYDLVILVALRIDPRTGGRNQIEGKIARWQRDAKDPDRYTTGNENFVTSLDPGDSWHFVAATGAGGKRYELELSFRELDHQRRKVETRKRVRMSFHYQMRDEGRSDGTLYETTKVVDLDADEGRTERIRIEAPADVADFDSCALHLTFWLDDVLAAWGAPAGSSEAQARFNMERMLVMNIKPSPDTTVIDAERIVMDEYQRALTLRPNKRVRIRLPRGDQGESKGSISYYLSPSIVETVEIKTLTDVAER